jgi:hypothetical protein
LFAVSQREAQRAFWMLADEASVACERSMGNRFCIFQVDVLNGFGL